MNLFLLCQIYPQYSKSKAFRVLAYSMPDKHAVRLLLCIHFKKLATAGVGCSLEAQRACEGTLANEAISVLIVQNLIAGEISRWVRRRRQNGALSTEYCDRPRRAPAGKMEAEDDRAEAVVQSDSNDSESEDCVPVLPFLFVVGVGE